MNVFVLLEVLLQGEGLSTLATLVGFHPGVRHRVSSQGVARAVFLVAAWVLAYMFSLGAHIYFINLPAGSLIIHGFHLIKVTRVTVTQMLVGWLACELA